MNKLSHKVIQQIETELAKGNKMVAIKIYKEATDVGLLEAKQVIEDWHEQKGILYGKTESKLWGNSTLTTAMIDEKIDAYLKDKQKLAAVKWLKEVKNLSLQDAKDYVENLAEKKKAQVSDFPYQQENIAINAEYSLGDTTAQLSLSAEDIEKQIQIYLNNNQKLEAIKWLKEQKGIGLKEAKDYVEIWEQKQKKEIFNASNSYENIQAPVNETHTENEGKIEFHLSPITYPENKDKNQGSFKNRLAIMLILAIFVYFIYKWINPHH